MTTSYGDNRLLVAVKGTKSKFLKYPESTPQLRFVFTHNDQFQLNTAFELIW